jgi:hypothetical protein
VSTAEQSIKLKSVEIQAISDKLNALTTDRNRLKHTAESLSKCLKSKITFTSLNASESSLDDCAVSEASSSSSLLGAPVIASSGNEKSNGDQATKKRFQNVIGFDQQHSKDNNCFSPYVSTGVSDLYEEATCTCDAGTVFEALFGSDNSHQRK